jgi:hypothetical protein
MRHRSLVIPLISIISYQAIRLVVDGACPEEPTNISFQLAKITPTNNDRRAAHGDGELEINYVTPVGGEIERHSLNQLERTPILKEHTAVALAAALTAAVQRRSARLRRKFEKTPPFQANYNSH